MRAFVAVNPSSGSRRAADAAALGLIRSRLADQGIQAQVQLVDARRLRGAVRQALSTRVDLVLVAGGDGSVSAAAAAMLGDERPLGIIPTGTRNHFARDLGMPARPEAALEGFASWPVREVDVAEVNGRVFVNNSALGLYPDIVLLRELDRTLTGSGRWQAFSRAIWRATRHPPRLEVRVATGGHAMIRRTSFLLVANNTYAFGLPRMWRRPRLDAGELAVYVAGELGRVELVELGLRAALGRIPDAAQLEMVQGRMVTVHSERARLRVSLDGEVVRLTPPLRYRTLPRALRVLAPSIPAERRPVRPAVEATRDAGPAS